MKRRIGYIVNGYLIEKKKGEKYVFVPFRRKSDAKRYIAKHKWLNKPKITTIGEGTYGEQVLKRLVKKRKR